MNLLGVPLLSTDIVTMALSCDLLLISVPTQYVIICEGSIDISLLIE